MNLENTPPIQAINPFPGGPIIPSEPPTAAVPANTLPTYPMPIPSPTEGMPADLSKREIVFLLPQQLPAKFVEAILNPARILAFLSQGLANPKSEAPQETPKAPLGQRDETTAKDGTGKGEDIVHIQVFKSDQSMQNSQNNKNETFQKSEATKSPDKNSNESRQLSEKGESFINEANQGGHPSSNGLNAENTRTAEPSESHGKEQLAKSDAAPLSKEPNQFAKTGETRSSSVSEPSAKEAPIAGGNEKANDAGKATPKEAGKELTRDSGTEKVKLSEGSAGNRSDGVKKPAEELQVSRQTPGTEIQAKRSVENIPQMQVEKPKESPDRLVDKIREKEQVESVQREDKYQHIEHPSGHRVLEHGLADNRSDSAALLAESAYAAVHAVDTDPIIPAWVAVFFNEQQQNEKLKRGGKSGGHKRLNELEEYRLGDLLFMLLAASVCGCKSIGEYIRFIQSREKWFKVILGAHCQIPPKELTWTLLSSFNPNTFKQPLQRWLIEICGGGCALKNIDGKPILPAISFWQSPIGLLMGQSKGSDPTLDALAIGSLLSLFNMERTVVAAKSASSHYDIAGYLDGVKANFIVEIEDQERSDLIAELIKSEGKNESAAYSKSESYIEGQDRIVVEAVAVSSSTRLAGIKSRALIRQYMKIQTEAVTSAGNSFENVCFISNLAKINDELFDLLRIQKPLERKVAWRINCLFPATLLASAMQHCQQNILQFRQFAFELLENTSGDLSLDEKIRLASSSGDELLKILRLRH